MNETLIDVHLKGAAFQMEGGVTTKYKRTWKIRIGLAQHTIDIEKKYNNELYTVTVDQESSFAGQPDARNSRGEKFQSRDQFDCEAKMFDRF